MNKPKKIKRLVNGVLLLDKPLGASSNQILQRVKHLYHAKKAGHTGSLDPLASGMLPICFGEATKFSQFLLDATKSYRVSATLGVRTATSDAEGEVVSVRDVPELTETEINAHLEYFRGETQQVPSMYSALKFNGQPLYKLARQGITVDRPARLINITALTVHSFKDNVIDFELTCSKGTYVRTIVDDLGERIGCGAHVSALRRLSVDKFPEADMVSYADLQAEYDEHQLDALDHYLLPMTTIVSHLPQLTLNKALTHYICLGQPVFVPHSPAEGLVALLTDEQQFIGVGELKDDGRVAPKRLVSRSSI